MLSAAMKILDIVSKFENVIYSHESNFPGLVSAPKTDNTMRSLAFSMLNQQEVLGHWVVIAHPDEFYVETFSDIGRRADLEFANIVQFEIWYAVPYFADHENLEAGIRLGPQSFNILSRVKYCVPSYYFTEERMFKYTSNNVRWGTASNLVTPEYFPNRKDFSKHPKYIHYKIHNFDKGVIGDDGQFHDSMWSIIPQNEMKTKAHGTMYSLLDDGEGVRCSDLVESYCDAPGIRCGTISRLNFTENEEHEILKYYTPKNLTIPIEPSACKRSKMRVGNLTDISWDICDIFETFKSCLVYSFGFGDDFSFDFGCERLGCRVHGFSPNVRGFSKYTSENKTFHQIGIGKTSLYEPGAVWFRWPGIEFLSGTNKEQWELVSVTDIRTKLGHLNTLVKILKIDVEGGEW